MPMGLTIRETVIDKQGEIEPGFGMLGVVLHKHHHIVGHTHRFALPVLILPGPERQKRRRDLRELRHSVGVRQHRDAGPHPAPDLRQVAPDPSDPRRLNPVLISRAGLFLLILGLGRRRREEGGDAPEAARERLGQLRDVPLDAAARGVRLLVGVPGLSASGVEGTRWDLLAGGGLGVGGG
jgi:hypothetical protein